MNTRGREAAGLIRGAIEQRRLGFGIIVSSPSARTRETLGLIGLDAAARWEDEIYLAGVDTLMGVVRALPDHAQSALIVGHNPGMHELVLTLGRPDSAGLRQRVLGKFPTGALAVLELEIGSWMDAAPGCGEIAELLLPRELG